MMQLITFCQNIFIIELFYIIIYLFSSPLTFFDLIIIIHIFLFLIWNKLENKNELYDIFTYIVLPFTLLYEYSIIYNITLIVKIFRIIDQLLLLLYELVDEFIFIIKISLSVIIVTIIFTYYSLKDIIKSFLLQNK